MQKIFIKNVIFIIIVAISSILLVNYFVTRNSLRETRVANANSKIDEVVYALKTNQTELQEIKEGLDADYLTRAKSAAYLIEKNQNILGDVAELKNFATLLDVDEIHVINEDGIIEYSSVPNYLNFDFHEHEQTQEFLAILNSDDEDACLVQEEQPNAAESKVMKYAGVARKDEKGIVQVGVEPIRLLEAQERNTYPYIFSRFPTERGEDFFAIDCTKEEVLGYSSGISEKMLKKCYEKRGFSANSKGELLDIDGGARRLVVTHQEGDILIGVACSEELVYTGLWKNMNRTLLYLVLVLVAVILFLIVLIRKTVIRGVNELLSDMDRITNGDHGTVVAVGGNPEFEQLSSQINTMVRSVVNSANRLSRIIEISGIPLAVFEIQEGSKQVFATSRLQSLLKIETEKYEELLQDSDLFIEKMHNIMSLPTEDEEDVFPLENGGYVRIRLTDSEGRLLGVVTDSTKNVMVKKQLKYENDHDHLTGLYRYSRFKEKAAKILAAMKPETGVAAVMLDMDSFKQINDTYGHDWGDKYLQKFAHIFDAQPKEHCLVARRSGDEFCMLIHNVSEESEVQQLLDNMWADLAQNPMEFPDGTTKVIKLSGGYCWTMDDKADLHALLRKADETLYRIKKSEKGAVTGANM